MQGRNQEANSRSRPPERIWFRQAVANELCITGLISRATYRRFPCSGLSTMALAVADGRYTIPSRATNSKIIQMASVRPRGSYGHAARYKPLK